MPNKVRRIAVLVKRDTPVEEGILRGIVREMRPLRRWLVRVEAPEASRLPMIQDWEPSGIICEVDRPDMEHGLQTFQAPVVNVGNHRDTPELASVGFDERAVGREAGRYFLDKGYRDLAFVGNTLRLRGRQRLEGYVEQLRAVGLSPSTLHLEKHPHLLSRENIWRHSDPALSRFLRQLPKPTAVFCDNDRIGRILAEVCRLSSIAVPERVAILGVSDDRLECELAEPALSSIQLPAERVGQESVVLLERLIKNPFAAKAPVALRLPPLGVVPRGSTDTVAIDDADLAEAVRFIREHALEAIAVDHILDHVAVSRRMLEQKFQRHLGRTPLSEIHRVRIEQACRLLASTTLDMAQVASASGFSSAERLSVRFKRITGLTPSAYRRQRQMPTETQPDPGE